MEHMGGGECVGEMWGQKKFTSIWDDPPAQVRVFGEWKYVFRLRKEHQLPVSQLEHVGLVNI
jgi:hypothetical protein